ncbi:MAG: 3-hydroxybutyryl-CoA dehydrogenase [Clostridia bacterium]|nr:MAG: 3-hydroxybutyryl-CoA dehydrogenase [Clostridia bacterium]
MGSEIAYTVARAYRCPLVVVDASSEILDRAKKVIERNAAKDVEKSKLTVAVRDEMESQITYTTVIEEVAGADFVIEAVPERMQLKQEIFAKLDRVCHERAVLASNTSGLSLTKIASATSNPGRVIGTHFFAPASVMRLVEIVRGLQTSEETIRIAEDFCRAMGKHTIVARDVPGFATTRVGMPMYIEAMRALEEGVATAKDIDDGMKVGMNHAMGPLETCDFIGLDTLLEVMENLAENYGDRFRPPVILRRMVEAGWLGRKTKRGFHTYE